MDGCDADDSLLDVLSLEDLHIWLSITSLVVELYLNLSAHEEAEELNGNTGKAFGNEVVFDSEALLDIVTFPASRCRKSGEAYRSKINHGFAASCEGVPLCGFVLLNAWRTWFRWCLVDGR